jgi:GDPmannose 4,6-dehydratase
MDINNRRKRALLTGITGQDGSYLTELLLEKGYEVHGIIRRSSVFNTQRIDHLYDDPEIMDKRLFLYYGDVTDSLSIDNIIKKVMPDEVYHLAAQSHVHVSFDVPKYTGECDALGTLHVLEAIKNHCPNAKFYNATTSELYGKVLETPQKETTPFNPRSPYGVAKLYSYHITKNYREAYGLFAVNGILFNHESPRRGDTFVTKKIVNGLNDYIDHGIPFYLGNLEAKRDWGYAPEYVEAMWLMLQHDEPEDFVIATGETHTIKEFIDECVKTMPWDPMDITWLKDEKGREILWDDNKDRLIIGIDERYYRPAEVDILLGDPSKAKEKLGWVSKTKFKDLVWKMMEERYNR